MSRWRRKIMNPLIKLKRRPQLALIVTALLVMCCNTSLREAAWFGPGCKAYNTYLEGDMISDDKFRCPITCPDGSIVMGDSKLDDNYTTLKTRALMTCSAPASELATPTLTATAAPGATSTPTASATPAPYLSGEVLACDLIDHYINFAFEPNPAGVVVSDFDVTIADQPVKCEIPSSNKKVLSCILPQGQTFPAQVTVHVDGYLIDTFSYDGSGCARPGPGNGGPGPQPDGEPICSGVPPYPEGCTPP
jgi:hypothetical protein